MAARGLDARVPSRMTSRPKTKSMARLLLSILMFNYGRGQKNFCQYNTPKENSLNLDFTLP